MGDIFLSLLRFLLGLSGTEGKQQPIPRELLKAASLTERETAAGRQRVVKVRAPCTPASQAGMCFCRNHGGLRASVTCARGACI